MLNPAKNTICLWYNGDAGEAARFYAGTFPDSPVGAVYCAPGDFPSGRKGDVLTVEFGRQWRPGESVHPESAGITLTDEPPARRYGRAAVREYPDAVCAVAATTSAGKARCAISSP